MTWGFIWLMFIMKIPIFMMFGIVWWAVRNSEDPAPEHPVRDERRPHPRRPRRRPRPRDPHGGPAVLPAPPRVREPWQTAARGRPLRDL
jgi:hypothetical protein